MDKSFIETFKKLLRNKNYYGLTIISSLIIVVVVFLGDNAFSRYLETIATHISENFLYFLETDYRPSNYVLTWFLFAIVLQLIFTVFVSVLISKITNHRSKK